MIKLIKRLGNINDFQLSKNLIITLKGESILNREVTIFDINFQENCLVKESIIPSFVVKGNIIVVYSKDKTWLFEVNNGNVAKTEYLGFYPIALLDNILLGNFYINDEQEILQCRSLNGHDVFWSIDYTSTILYCSKCLYIVKFGDNLTKLQLFALEINTGAKLWHYTIPSEYTYQQRFDDRIYQDEISHIIGVHGDLLWIVLATGRLLGLSVEDGTLVHELTRPNNYVDEPYRRAYANNVFRAALHTQLDEAKGILFGLWKTFYWEIDLKNPTSSYLLYDITASFQHWNISAEMPNGHEWAWEKDEIFFGEIYDSERRDSTTNTVGIFDRSKKEVTWADRVGKRGETQPMVQKIDYAAGRLYVLDGEGTLHIFER